MHRSFSHHSLNNIKRCEYLICFSSVSSSCCHLYVSAFFALSPFLLFFKIFLLIWPALLLSFPVPLTSIIVCVPQASAPRMEAQRRRRISRVSPRSRSSSTRDRPEPRGGSGSSLTGSTSRRKPSRSCCRSQ